MHVFLKYDAIFHWGFLRALYVYVRIVWVYIYMLDM